MPKAKKIPEKTTQQKAREALAILRKHKDNPLFTRKLNIRLSKMKPGGPDDHEIIQQLAKEFES